MSVQETRSPRFDRTGSWFEAEVPAIVAGLEASKDISVTTAARARQLVDEGAYQQALSLVLGEVF